MVQKVSRMAHIQKSTTTNLLMNVTFVMRMSTTTALPHSVALCVFVCGGYMQYAVF